MPNNVKKKIMRIITKHPEGLSVSEIAKFVGMHRTNITKYIYELKGEGKVFIREIGKAKLCYPTDKYKKFSLILR